MIQTATSPLNALTTSRSQSTGVANPLAVLPPDVSDQVKGFAKIVGAMGGAMVGAELGAITGAVAGYEVAKRIGLDPTQGAIMGAISGATVGAGLGGVAGKMGADIFIDAAKKAGLLT